MAKESVKILRGKLDVDNLLSQLNAALAEEWLAYYQYWVGALVVEGAMRSDVQGEFEEHAEEERHHAQLLADRIIELEGVPVLDPKQWFELARCKYDSPTDFRLDVKNGTMRDKLSDLRAMEPNYLHPLYSCIPS